jgi:hypothetical protein
MSQKPSYIDCTPNELADWVIDQFPYSGFQKAKKVAFMLREQAKEIEQLNFVLKNLVLATNKKIEQLEQDAKDCTCQGGHSEAYLKAKGKV